MAKLSYDDLVSVALAAGFPRSQAPVAAAIAMAESGGNPSATNKNTNGSTDYGLWQINSIHGPILQQGKWSNPNDNAKMAYKVYQNAGNSFRPWVTFKSGSYKKFVDKGYETAVDDATGNNATNAGVGDWFEYGTRGFRGDGLSGSPDDLIKPYKAIKGAASIMGDIGHILGVLTDLSFWRRLGIGVLGFGILFFGFLFIVNSTKTGKQLKGAAVTAATRGTVPPPSPTA